MASENENRNYARNGVLIDILSELISGLKIVDESGHIADVDLSHSAIVTIDSFHHKIHKGDLFYISKRFVGVNTPQNILFRIESNDVHIKFNVNTGLACYIEIIEGVSVSAVGNAITKQNYHRDSVKTVPVLVYEGATFSGGTVFRENQSGHGTSPGTATSGVNSTQVEYMFKPNTDYILRLTPGAATNIIVISDFYEGLQ